jgi:hypothetical protein
MKKILFTLTLLFSVSLAFSQWGYELVKNDFDDPYRIAYTPVNNGSILKLENLSGSVFFYIQGGYFCDEYPTVDLVFVVNGVNSKYSVEGIRNEANDVVFISTDIVNEEFYNDFKKCSTIKIRVNETSCGTETYSFNMSKSTSALNYIQYK